MHNSLINAFSQTFPSQMMSFWLVLQIGGQKLKTPLICDTTQIQEISQFSIDYKNQMPISHILFGHRRRLRLRTRLNDRQPDFFLQMMLLINLGLTGILLIILITSIFLSLDLLPINDVLISMGIAIALVFLIGGVMFSIKFQKLGLLMRIQKMLGFCWKIWLVLISLKIIYLGNLYLTIFVVICLAVYQRCLVYIISHWPQKIDEIQFDDFSLQPQNHMQAEV